MFLQERSCLDPKESIIIKDEVGTKDIIIWYYIINIIKKLSLSPKSFPLRLRMQLNDLERTYGVRAE